MNKMVKLPLLDLPWKCLWASFDFASSCVRFDHVKTAQNSTEQHRTAQISTDQHRSRHRVSTANAVWRVVVYQWIWELLFASLKFLPLRASLRTCRCVWVCVASSCVVVCSQVYNLPTLTSAQLFSSGLNESSLFQVWPCLLCTRASSAVDYSHWLYSPQLAPL